MSNRKYYSVNELITLSDNKLTPEIVGNYVRDKSVRAIIYINSLEAHACELKKQGHAIVIGQCLLSCYLDLGVDMIPAINELLSYDYFKMSTLIENNQLIEPPEIYCWEYNAKYFTGVLSEHKNPKPYSNNLDIQCFILLSQDMKSKNLSWNNIFINEADLKYFKTYLTAQPNQPSENKGKKNRTHVMINLLKDICREQPKLNAEEIWKHLRKLADKDHDILQQVDHWTLRDAKIYWISHTGKEREMMKSAFIVRISEISSGKR